MLLFERPGLATCAPHHDCMAASSLLCCKVPIHLMCKVYYMAILNFILMCLCPPVITLMSGKASLCIATKAWHVAGPCRQPRWERGVPASRGVMHEHEVSALLTSRFSPSVGVRAMCHTAQP